MTRFEDFDRRSGIGASEVPAIAGLSPWRTPVAVWLDKVGLAGGQPQTPGMRTGTALEHAVLKIAADEVGVPLRHNRSTFVHRDWPEGVRLFATPDGFAPRRHALAEVKVVGWRGQDWKEGPPPYVLAQVQAQLAVLPKVKGALVAALIGSEVRTFEVERDEVIGDDIAERVRVWWDRHVIGGESPPPQTEDDEWAIVRGRVSPPPREVRTPGLSEEVLAAELVVLLNHSDQIAAQIVERRLALAEASARADLVGEGWRATWSERTSTDWRAVAREAAVPPNVVDIHTHQSPVFTFRRSTPSGEAQDTPTNGVAP